MKYLQLKQQMADALLKNQRLEAELKDVRMRYLDSLDTIKAMTQEMVSSRGKHKIFQMEVQFSSSVLLFLMFMTFFFCDRMLSNMSSTDFTKVFMWTLRCIQMS